LGQQNDVASAPVYTPPPASTPLDLYNQCLSKGRDEEFMKRYRPKQAEIDLGASIGSFREEGAEVVLKESSSGSLLVVDDGSRLLVFPQFGIVDEAYMKDVVECFVVSVGSSRSRDRLVQSIEQPAVCSRLPDGRWQLNRDGKGRLTIAR
jgi:hypothetical protein